MTTDKPKWWRSWVVYGLIGLLVTVGPYVGGYFWMLDYGPTSRHTTQYMEGLEKHHRLGIRTYKHDALATAFRPLAWLEAKIGGMAVYLEGRTWGEVYEPGW